MVPLDGDDTEEQLMDRCAAPPLAEMIAPLEAMTGIDHIQPDVPLKDLGIDSIDVLEWIFMVEDRLALAVDELMGDATQLESFGDITLQELYDALVAFADPSPAA